MPLQFLHQPHTVLKKDPSASVTSLCSAPTVNPKTHPPVITQIDTLPFVAMNKYVKTFDELTIKLLLKNI